MKLNVKQHYYLVLPESQRNVGKFAGFDSQEQPPTPVLHGERPVHAGRAILPDVAGNMQKSMHG